MSERQRRRGGRRGGGGGRRGWRGPNGSPAARAFLDLINIAPPDFSHTEPLDWVRTRVLALEGILLGLDEDEARAFALTIVHWLCSLTSDVFLDRPVPRSWEELEEFIYPTEK